jgi:catechol-2,3-dioxygenase
MATKPKADQGFSYLDHFALPAMDLDRAEQFYTSVLDGKLIVKGPHPIALDGLFIQFGENHMGLFPQSVVIPPPQTVDSYPRCAFTVPSADFEKVSRKIKKSSRLKQTIKCDVECRFEEGLVFTDSEGNLLEFLRGAEEAATRIDHLHLDTLALQHAINFYASIFNLELLKEDEHSAVMGMASGQKIILHQARELSEWSNTPYRERHFAFHVTAEAFDLIVRHLSKKGIEESTDIAQGVARRKGDLNFYFRDPNTPFQLQITNGTSQEFCELFRSN